MKKVTLLNVLLTMVIVVLIGTSLSFFTKNTELQSQKKQLQKSLEKEKEVGGISKLTQDFIEKSSVGQQEDMLTGEAKQNFEKALKEQGKDTEYYGKQLLDNVDIINLFAKKTGDTTATSYAIYQLSYKYSPEQTNDTGSQRVMILSLTANWKQEKGKFKVNNYKIGLLQDNLDNYLKQTQKESETPNEKK